jgi:hypothetical protein
MSLNGKPLDQITEADLQALVDNSVQENRILEFKRIAVGSKDDDKREFLADVTAMANSSGGHILYGVVASSGVATSIDGIALADTDKEYQRLDSLLQSGVAPRLPGVAMLAVPLSNGNLILILRIPRSFVRPHMVTLFNYSRFFARNSAGKYQLDVQELRLAFTQSDVMERIKAFRRDRLAAISIGETPLPIGEGAKIVLHIVPLSAFDPGTRHDVISVNVLQAKPLYCTSSMSSKINLDGLVTYQNMEQGAQFGVDTYLQVYRNGSIEAVETCLLGDYISGKKAIPSTAFERAINEGLSEWARLLEEVGVEAPIAVMLSLLGVKGYSMFTDRFQFGRSERFIIDRDEVLVSEVIVEDLQMDMARVMRPAFDEVWNASGHASSPNYDKDGDWQEHRR